MMLYHINVLSYDITILLYDIVFLLYDIVVKFDNNNNKKLIFEITLVSSIYSDPQLLLMF